MKKLSIILMTLLLFSCQDQAANNTADENNNVIVEENVETKETVQEETSRFEFDVQLKSTFSNEDLIYFIMIDRFNDGDLDNNNFEDYSDNHEDLRHYLGGDFKGITEKLDYIKGLGATAIWITPVVDNEPFGYHGYWTSDFEAVNPHFGSMEDLKELVAEAHKRDIKILLDYVVNHTGYQHDWLNDPDKKDWFHAKGDITNYNDKDQLLNYNLAGLPDLNTENPQVKDYFFNNVMWWIEETGVDGLRLDTVKHVPEDYWNEFAYIIKSTYPDFFLLGEVFHSSPSYLAGFNEVGFDSVTNFSIYNGIKDTFKIYGDANKLKIAINNDQKFDDFTMNSIFLDNHDVSRLISRTSKHGTEYLYQGLTFIMTYPSIPVIYYGTEIGLEGKDDPENRNMMTFIQNDTYIYYQTLLELRNKTRDFKTVSILDVHSDYIVLEYTNGSESYVTAFNISLYEKTITLENNYTDYFTEEQVSGQLILQPLETRILWQE